MCAMPILESVTDEIKTTSADLQEKVRSLLQAGDATRITINNLDGHLMLEIPTSDGLAGLILAPVISLDISAICVYESEYIIAVTRDRARHAGSNPIDPITNPKTNLQDSFDS